MSSGYHFGAGLAVRAVAPGGGCGTFRSRHPAPADVAGGYLFVAHVRGYGGIPPLFQPPQLPAGAGGAVPDGVSCPDFGAERRALVGGAASGSSSLLGPRAGHPLAPAAWILVGARRLGAVQRARLLRPQENRGHGAVPGASLAGPVSLGSDGGVCGFDPDGGRRGSLRLGLRRLHRPAVPLHFRDQLAGPPVRQPALRHRRTTAATTGCLPWSPSAKAGTTTITSRWAVAGRESDGGRSTSPTAC